jgi:formylglycine-generating enzyme required for sulfatase activity
VQVPADAPSADATTVVTHTDDARPAFAAPDDWRQTWIVIPAGTYDVGGAPNASLPVLAAQRATVTSFAIDSTEMTKARAVAALTPAIGAAETAKVIPASGLLDAPVASMQFRWAVSACEKIGGRLPTEIEWEIAARTTPNDPQRAHLLGLPAQRATDCSAAGLCNMLGGLAEWTSTVTADNKRIVRGGSFAVSPKAGWYASTFARAAVGQLKRDPEIGFRCVMDIPSKP